MVLQVKSFPHWFHFSDWNFVYTVYGIDCFSSTKPVLVFFHSSSPLIMAPLPVCSGKSYDIYHFLPFLFEDGGSVDVEFQIAINWVAC